MSTSERPQGAGERDGNELPVSAPHPIVTAITTAARGGLLWLAVAGFLSLRRGPWRQAAGRGLISAAAAMAAGHAVKKLVHRRRPATDGLPARRALPERPSSSSFPSTHAATAAAFVVGVALRAPAAAAAAAPLAALVCYGRLRTRVHWPTDVYGGAALGAATAFALHRLSSGVHGEVTTCPARPRPVSRHRPPG
jgi:undecaprenyl-diphosphatase